MRKLTWDATNRDEMLRESGLDFADAAEIFSGVHFEFPEEGNEGGANRTLSVGFLAGRMVIVAWEARVGDERHILAMRRANEREQQNFGHRLGSLGSP